MACVLRFAAQYYFAKRGAIKKKQNVSKSPSVIGEVIQLTAWCSSDLHKAVSECTTCQPKLKRTMEVSAPGLEYKTTESFRLQDLSKQGMNYFSADT